MYSYVSRLSSSRVLLALAFIAVMGVASANAAILTYTVIMDGPSESPPVASPGTGSGTVTFDTVLHTMRVQGSWTGLVGNTTVSHIHGPTTLPFAGTAGVATTTPTFTGFPAGVTAGSYDHTFDMTLASSYNASFITANGGSPATAEVAMHGYVAAGRMYWNIHSSFVASGEIRGFLVPAPVPAESKTWGSIKALYR